MPDIAPRGPWADPGFARRYDETFARSVAPLAGQALLALANPQPGEAVLECACGTGAFTVPLAQRLGAPNRLVSSDRAEAMLAIAAAKAPQLGCARPLFVAQDMTAPAMRESSFNLAACNLGMHIVSDPRRAMGELHRLLLPRGRLAFSVPGEWSLEPFWTYFWQRASRPDAVTALRTAPPSWTPADLAASLDRDRRSWQQLMANAGYGRVVTAVDGGVAWFPSVEDFLATGPFGHIGRARELFTDPEVAERVFRDVGQRLQQIKSSHGIPIDITVLCVLGYRAQTTGDE